jgi:cytochrome oxidase Cu insertion factor (SCO1/SenC/PrrC family)
MRRTSITAILLLTAFLALGSITLVFAFTVGDKAPDFTLPATTAEKWTLSDLMGKKNVVLFAFIGAFTPT